MSLKPKVFILHCGLDIKKVARMCEKLDLDVDLVTFRREDVFSYYVRLDRPRPDLILIRSHFRSLIASLNQQKRIPTIVISTHARPGDCCYSFVRARQGYDASDSLPTYKELAVAMREALSS
jgi:hypothetical protein